MPLTIQRTTEKFPTQSWKKFEIQEYQTQKGIGWESSEIKAELIKKADSFYQTAKKYRVDEMASKAGHTVLRLLPYHCDLNPIELAWVDSKNDVALHIVTYKIKEVGHLLNDTDQ